MTLSTIGILIIINFACWTLLIEKDFIKNFLKGENKVFQVLFRIGFLLSPTGTTAIILIYGLGESIIKGISDADFIENFKILIFGVKDDK